MHALIRLYTVLIAFGRSLQNLFLLFIRLFWGWSFFRTGFGKLLNIENVISFFQSLGVPMPAFSAYTASMIECFGGILLFLGLGSRLVAIPLMCTMIIAYLTAFSDAVRMVFTNPLDLATKDPFSFFFISLVVFIFGPGKFSLDYWLRKKYFDQRF